MHEHSIVNDLAWILFAAAVAALGATPFQDPPAYRLHSSWVLSWPPLGLGSCRAR